MVKETGRDTKEKDSLKIVVVGGGTGLSTLLRGLKTYPWKITAIVTITDEGGSSGILREELNVPPPGDIRNNLVALANDEDILGKVFNYRFKNGSLNGHTVGNIILAALTMITGNFMEAVSKAADILAIKGRVLPVSTEMARLVAIFEDGSKVSGETRIVKYCKETGKRIVDIKLDNCVKLNSSAYEVIVNSDAIIFGPGSLYTSIIANFLVDGFSEAVSLSNAKKIYVSNIMTQPGETQNYKLSDHIREVERYLNGNLDVIIHSLPPKDERILNEYREKNSLPVEIDINDERIIIGHFSNIIIKDTPKIRHDSFLLSKAIYELTMNS
ncbi:MAG: uridine diphosphate-N-acetylglucosamine-binding protein YvcK [Fervidobacterium sp.]